MYILLCTVSPVELVGGTPLHWFAMRGDAVSMKKPIQLVMAGADIDTVDGVCIYAIYTFEIRDSVDE